MKQHMKKILYIDSTLKRSGPTNILYNLIKHIDRSEFEPYILTLSPEENDSRWGEFLGLGINLYSLNLSRIKGIFFAKRRVQSLLNEIKPTLIHTQGIRGDIISAGLKTSVPRINTIHNFPQYDYIMTYGRIVGNAMVSRHIRVIDKMSACIGVSQAVTENLKIRYNISNILCVQNGIDTDVFFPSPKNEKENLRKRLNLPAGVRIFISSGHLSKGKDPLFLIRNWAECLNGHRDVQLVFIGDGKLREECEKECKNIENIHIIGRINNVVDYLRASDYFISSSHSEGLPNAVLEALACGLPVLLSNIGPHKEIVDMACDIGFCYELGNKNSFIGLFNKLLCSDRTVMGRAASNLIGNKMSARVMSDNYQKIYNDILFS
jgi:glycosyltransferase involved in cell wall biosynthesis